MVEVSKLESVTKGMIVDIAKNYGDVVVLDMSYHMYRSYYAYSNLSVENELGMYPTGHIYGFMRLITYVRQNLPNCAIVIAVDGYDRERKELDSNYKSGRSREFNVHKDTNNILSLCSLFEGIFVSYNNEYEADDTIKNICETMDYLFKKNGIKKKIYIYSSDKDLYQCISEDVLVLKSFGKGAKDMEGSEVVDVNGCREKFEGVGPDRLVYFRSIVGDGSDGLKGITRFPKKVASKIARFGEFDESGFTLNLEMWGEVSKTEQKWIDMLKEEYSSVFWKNYRIMKLKDYNYTITKLNREEYQAMVLINRFELNSFKYLLNKEEYRDMVLIR